MAIDIAALRAYPAQHPPPGWLPRNGAHGNERKEIVLGSREAQADLSS